MRPSNSDVTIGISTRSCSGVSLPDPVPIKPVSFRPEIQSVEAFLDMNCINPPPVSSIKDLRARRVSTRDLNSVMEEEELDEEIEKRRKLLKVSDASSDSGRVDEGNGVENGLNLKDQPIFSYPSLSKGKMSLNRFGQRKVFKNSSSFGYRRLLPYLMDIVNADSSVSKIEIVDAEIPCKLQKFDAVKSSKVVSGGPHFDDKNPSENNEERIDASVAEECVQMTPPDPDIFAKREVTNGAEHQIFKRGTNSINRPVLNPCSRLRLFKNPGSLSYRRLLPFLMDISNNNNSCASKIAQDPVPNNEQNDEEKIRTENSHEKQHTDDRMETLLENSNRKNSEQGSDCEENIPTKQSTFEEHGLVGKPKNNCFDTGLEDHNNNRQSIEKVNSKESSSRNEVSEALLSPRNGCLKGILRRNRRGCRGLCNCLNCASFRLNADRAFEFSRNQMNDAQELASELMNELANLRLLLDKSTCSGDINPVIKQACNKALETEKQAKERLSQLNYELDVHCRIPMLVQPKVTFANYIQEKAIPVSNSTENNE
ncbi:hypothetical protein ABFS83_07G074200 [Erythranthe nasuta]